MLIDTIGAQREAGALMRFRLMSVRLSKAPSVRDLFLHPIHQPTLSKGSQDEIASVSPLF
jgi:hypothetical protein